MCGINRKYKKKLSRADKIYKTAVEDMKTAIRIRKENDEYKKNPFFVKDWFKKKFINNSIVFIFACPGIEEFIGNKPCCGQTGDNLDVFIGLLNKDFPDVFQDTDRYSYVILNASDKVHFDELTSNSEPYESEIKTKVDNDLKDPNKKGLIQNAKLIFCFGGKAKKYYDKIKEQLDEVKKPIECCHLGARGLNNCEDLTTYLNEHKILEKLSKEEKKLSLEDKVNYLYKLKKEQIEKMVKTLNSSSQEQKN